MRRPERIGIVVIVAVVSGMGLLAAGSGSLASPPIGSWSDLDQWYETAGPGRAFVAVVRLAALGAAAWLTIAGGLQLLAPMARGTRLQLLADWLSPRLLRSLAQGAAGLSVTAGLAVPSPLAGPAGNPPGTAVMVPLDVADATTTTTTSTTSTTTTTTAAPRPSAPATPVPIAEPQAPAPTVDEIIVAPGDSFWSIAVDEAAGRDLVAYWRDLIDANLDRLADPSNPDLLYPDQVLRLP